MTRRKTAAAFGLGLLFACGCAEKPESGGGTAGKTPPVQEGTAYGVSELRWTRLLPQDATRFGAQGVILGPSPPSGLAAPPEPEAGTLHYGVLRMGGEPRAGRARDVGDAGGRDVFLAVLESPKPEEGEERHPWRLLIDRDLDADLREERPVAARPLVRSRGEVEVSGAQFPVVEILGPLGGVHALLVNVLVTRAGEGKRTAVLQAQTACALAGRVRIFGAERDVVVYDGDANGVFGDYMKTPDRAGDVIWVDFDADGRRDDGEMLFLAPRVLHQGKVAAVEVSPDARELAVADLEVPFGSITPAGASPSGKVTVQLFSDEYRLIAPGPADAVPAGSYELVRYAIEREDKIDGSKWVLAGGWLPGTGPSVRVREGETAELSFGPPIQPRAWLRYDAGAGPHGSDAQPAGEPSAESTTKGTLIIVTLRGGASENVRLGFTVDGKEKLADWGEFRILDGERVLGEGKLDHMPAMPGAGGAIWKPPEGAAGIEEGTRLALEVSPDLGPFKEGFEGRIEFEYGRPTPIRLVVSEVEPGTQADRVGLKPGDLILRYDSEPVNGPTDLVRAMRAAAGKARVELAVLRGGTEINFALLPGKIGIMTALALP